MERTSTAPAAFPAASTPAVGYASSATLTEGALAMAPETSAPPQAAPNPAPASAPNAAPGLPPSIDSLRHGVGSALVGAGHDSAAQLLGISSWILDTSSLRIEVPGVGKKMLSLTVNAAAEKLIRQELQRQGAPARFMVVPGEGTAQSAATSQAACRKRPSPTPWCSAHRKSSRQKFEAWSIYGRSNWLGKKTERAMSL
jgi:hypothetical protein